MSTETKTYRQALSPAGGTVALACELSSDKPQPVKVLNCKIQPGKTYSLAVLPTVLRKPIPTTNVAEACSINEQKRKTFERQIAVLKVLFDEQNFVRKQRSDLFNKSTVKKSSGKLDRITFCSWAEELALGAQWIMLYKSMLFSIETIRREHSDFSLKNTIVGWYPDDSKMCRDDWELRMKTEHDHILKNYSVYRQWSRSRKSKSDLAGCSCSSCKPAQQEVGAGNSQSTTPSTQRDYYETILADNMAMASDRDMNWGDMALLRE